MKRKLRSLLREVRRLEQLSGFDCIDRQVTDAGISFTFVTVPSMKRAELLISKHDLRRSEASLAVTLNHRFETVKKALATNSRNRVEVTEVRT